MNYFVTGLCWLEKQAGIWAEYFKEKYEIAAGV